MPDLPVTDGVVIPANELEFRATRSSGPGGQHVNRSATRIELWWNVADTRALTEDQISLVRRRLGRRVRDDGRIRLVAQRYRSQQRNREDALERLARIVARALRPRATRRPTKPTRASKEERLKDKRKRSDIKRLRRPPEHE